MRNKKILIISLLILVVFTSLSFLTWEFLQHKQLSYFEEHKTELTEIHGSGMGFSYEYHRDRNPYYKASGVAALNYIFTPALLIILLSILILRKTNKAKDVIWLPLTLITLNFLLNTPKLIGLIGWEQPVYAMLIFLHGATVNIITLVIASIWQFVAKRKAHKKALNVQ